LWSFFWPRPWHWPTLAIIITVATEAVEAAEAEVVVATEATASTSSSSATDTEAATEVVVEEVAEDTEVDTADRFTQAACSAMGSRKVGTELAALNWCFERLHQECPASLNKLAVVDGDLAEENLGLNIGDYQRLASEAIVHVSTVFVNCEEYTLEEQIYPSTVKADDIISLAR
ncbi:hypothetical protein IscW_ISCW000932, partial [Ixodes scapularis]